MAKESNIDYGFIGMSMSDIQKAISSTFIGGINRNRMPKAMMIWGAPGVGKTFTVYAAAREIARRLKISECMVVDNPTSCLEPCDITGVPMPVRLLDGEEKFTRYLALEWAWLASIEYEQYERIQRKNDKWKAPPMILFFDDIPAAHLQTQTAFFKGVHEGKWGSLNQRPNVMTIGAGNRVEDNAGANDMPTALANRFRHVYANPTTDDWLRWAGSTEGGIHPWVIAFIRTCKEDLQEFNKDVAMRSEKAFASPRTWHDLSEFLWEGEIAQAPETQGLFAKSVMGMVGKGIGTKFLGFLRSTTAVVPPDEIVRNPKTAKVPSNKNLDALHATISSLELHLKQNPKDWKACVIYACRKEMLPDVGILLAKTVATVIHTLPPAERLNMITDDVFVELAERYEDLLDSIVIETEDDKKKK